MQIHVDENLELTEGALATLRRPVDPLEPAADLRQGPRRAPLLRRLIRRALLLAIALGLFLELSPPGCLGLPGQARWIRAQGSVGDALGWPGARRRGMAVIGHAEALAERIHRSARAASQSLVAAWQASGQCGPAQPRALSEARFWQAARERINVRTGPATIYAELGQVQLGAVLPIRGDLDGAWVPVTAPGGQRGWVYGELGLGLGAIPCPLTVDGARPICAAPSGESCDPVRLTDGGETLVIAAGPRRGGYIPLQLGPSRVGWLSPP